MKAVVAVMVALACLATGAKAQDHQRHQHMSQAPMSQGHIGQGHETWHEQFYSKLVRRDTQTSCCNMSDCRPTESRMVGDHYEVMIDGAWVSVPASAIQNVAAPDGGAHVCAPPQVGSLKGVIYCVILPPEG